MKNYHVAMPVADPLLHSAQAARKLASSRLLHMNRLIYAVPSQPLQGPRIQSRHRLFATPCPIRGIREKQVWRTRLPTMSQGLGFKVCGFVLITHSADTLQGYPKPPSMPSLVLPQPCPTRRSQSACCLLAGTSPTLDSTQEVFLYTSAILQKAARSARAQGMSEKLSGQFGGLP